MLIFPLFISGSLFVVVLVVICNVKMKRISSALLIISAFLSCNKAVQPLTKAEIKQKADSISDIRIRQADEQAKTDLEYRMKIEVKVKVDSILNARIKSPVKDTARKNTVKQEEVKSDPNRNVIRRRDTDNRAGINNRRSIQGDQNSIQVGTNSKANLPR